MLNNIKIVIHHCYCCLALNYEFFFVFNEIALHYHIISFNEIHGYMMISYLRKLFFYDYFQVAEEMFHIQENLFFLIFFLHIFILYYHNIKVIT